MSHRFAIAILVTAVALLVLSAPSSAMAKYWVVKDNVGQKQGLVSPGKNQYGMRQGEVWTWGPSAYFQGVVFHETQDGFAGWVVEKGEGTGTWIALIVKKSATRYVILGRRGFAQRTPAGYWIVKKRVNGKYRRIGSVQKGCPGAYALGAARLVLWH